MSISLDKDFITQVAKQIEELGNIKAENTIYNLIKTLKNQIDVLAYRVEEVEEMSSQVYQIPRGERADFLKITVTLPSDLLVELKSLGIRRKAAKMKDTDTSSLIREAVIEFLNNENEA